MAMCYKGHKQDAKIEPTDRVAREGLFKEMTFRLPAGANTGVNYVNSQEKNAADRGNSTCAGPEGGGSLQ